MFFNTPISPSVQKTLFKKMRDLERKGFQNGLLEPTSYENNPIGSMMTKTCWARATSAVPILGNDGKPTEDLDLVRLSSGVTKDSQPINEPIAFINDIPQKLHFGIAALIAKIIRV